MKRVGGHLAGQLHTGIKLAAKHPTNRQHIHIDADCDESEPQLPNGAHYHHRRHVRYDAVQLQ